MRIVFGGPPHSGKSVLLWYLKSLLPIGSYMPVRAAPDGEGDWTQLLYQSQSDVLVQQLRKKGGFTDEFVSWAANAVKNCVARFGLIDVGGKPSPENRVICQEADAIILLSSDQEKIQEWLNFANELGLKVLAILHSTLEPVPETWNLRGDGVFEGLVVGLDRQKFQGSRTIEALVKHLLVIIPAPKKELQMNTLTIEQMAAMIGKKEEEYILPNGSPKKGLNWKPSDLPLVAEKLKPLSAMGTPWFIDGAAVQWLAVSVVEDLHPCTIVLADTKVDGGRVPLGQRKYPVEGGRGELLFKIEDRPDFVVVRYEAPGNKPLNAELLPELYPPVVAPGKPVLLNGRTTNWAIAEMAMCYMHVVPAVYVGQPANGRYWYVCAITHSPKHELGSVLYEDEL